MAGKRTEGKNLTEGKPWRVIGSFAIPLLIGNVVQQAYQLTDTIVVGRFLGVNPLASVGSTGSLLFLIIGFSWGMTSGLAIPVAQAFGARKFDELRRSVAVGAMIAGATALLMTIIGVVTIGPLLRAMQTPEILMEDAITYGFFSFLFLSAIVAFNFLAAIIRAVGDSKTPLIFLMITAVVNIVLDLLFIGVFGWGVEGAAIATAIAEVSSVALCVWWIGKSFTIFHLKREDLRVTWAQVRRHLAMGMPLGFQMSIIAIGSLALQVRLNSLGEEAVAAFTTASRVDGIAVTFLSSLGLAASTFIAQNYGGRRYDRVRAGLRQGVALAVIVSIVVALVLVALSRVIVTLFVGKDAVAVIAMAADAVKIYAICYWILAILFVVRGALQGLGRMKAPFYSGVAELVMRVITAIWLGDVFGFIGVAWGVPLAWVGSVALLVPSYIYFNKRLLSGEPAGPAAILNDDSPSTLIKRASGKKAFGADQTDADMAAAVTEPALVEVEEADVVDAAMFAEAADSFDAPADDAAGSTDMDAAEAAKEVVCATC